MSKSVDFVHKINTVIGSKSSLVEIVAALEKKEYECQFIRESSQRIIQTKDRLLIQKDVEINELKKKLALKSTSGTSATSCKSQIVQHRVHHSPPSPPGRVLSKNVCSSIEYHLDDLEGYSQFMEGEINGLRHILEENEQTISRLSNMINVHQIQILGKDKELKTLRKKCEQYQVQCDDFIRAGEIMAKSEVAWERPITLSESEIFTVRQLFDALKAIKENEDKMDISTHFQQRLNWQCQTLQDLHRKYNNNGNKENTYHSIANQKRKGVVGVSGAKSVDEITMNETRINPNVRGGEKKALRVTVSNDQNHQMQLPQPSPPYRVRNTRQTVSDTNREQKATTMGKADDLTRTTIKSVPERNSYPHLRGSKASQRDEFFSLRL